MNFQQSKQLAIQTFFSPYKTKNVLKENKQIWHKKYACSWTLSVPQISQFSLSLAFCFSFLRTGNIKGQIYKDGFSPNIG